MNPPIKHGRYLVCVYEWVGLSKDIPETPKWVIKDYKGYWERQQYSCDTGGYENLLVLTWQELPSLPTM